MTVLLRVLNAIEINSQGPRGGDAGSVISCNFMNWLLRFHDAALSGMETRSLVMVTEPIQGAFPSTNSSLLSRMKAFSRRQSFTHFDCLRTGTCIHHQGLLAQLVKRRKLKITSHIKLTFLFFKKIIFILCALVFGLHVSVRRCQIPWNGELLTAVSCYVGAGS